MCIVSFEYRWRRVPTNPSSNPEPNALISKRLRHPVDAGNLTRATHNRDGGSFCAHFAKSSRAHSSSFLVERPHVISSPISDVVCHLAVKGWIIKLTNSMFWRGHPSHSQNMTHKFISFRGTYQSAHECARSPAPAKLNGSLPKRDIFLNLRAKAGN